MLGDELLALNGKRRMKNWMLVCLHLPVKRSIVLAAAALSMALGGGKVQTGVFELPLDVHGVEEVVLPQAQQGTHTVILDLVFGERAWRWVESMNAAGAFHWSGESSVVVVSGGGAVFGPAAPLADRELEINVEAWDGVLDFGGTSGLTVVTTIAEHEMQMQLTGPGVAYFVESKKPILGFLFDYETASMSDVGAGAAGFLMETELNGRVKYLSN